MCVWASIAGFYKYCGFEEYDLSEILSSHALGVEGEQDSAAEKEGVMGFLLR